MSDWKSVKLRSVCNDEKDAFTDGDWIESPYISKSGIRFIQTGNIGIGTFNDSNKKFISEKTFEELKCTKIVPNDLLICRMADPIGRACLAPSIEDRFITSVDVTIAKPNPKIADARFLMYRLNSDHTLSQSKAVSAGSTRQRISRTELGNLTFLLPPLPEQSKIAEILSTVDQVIELTEKEISRLEDLKKGMMCDLTYGRLEGGERTTWENITTPKDWGYKTIGSILRQIERPITLDDNATYQLITVKRRNEGIVEREALLGKKILVKNYFSLKKGDFVISKRQIVHGACEIVPPTLDGSVVSNEYDVFTGTEEMDIDFFNEFAKTPTMKEIFFRYSQGVDIEKMIFKTNWWLKQVIPVPPIEYQNKVVTALKSVNTQIQNRKSKLSSLQSLKKALMNDLLTGKVRVKV